MCDVDEILSDLEPGNPMVEAVTGAFGSLFGIKRKNPISPLVEWIVRNSGLPRTQVDNFVRAHRNDPDVLRAINGDEASRCNIMKEIAIALGVDVFNDTFTVPEILTAGRRNARRPAPASPPPDDRLEATGVTGNPLVESGITVNYDNGQPFDIELGQRILNNIDPAYNSLKQEITDFVGRAGATWETFKKLSLHYAVDGVPEDFNIPFCFDVERDDDLNVRVTNESYPVPGTPRPYYTRWLHWTPGLSYSADFTFEDDTGLFMDVQEISADDDNRAEIFIEAAYEAIVACLLCLLWEKVPTEYVQADEP